MKNDNKSANDRMGSCIALGLCFGPMIGLMLGEVFGNIAAGMCYGSGIGICTGALLGALSRKKDK